MSQIQEVLITGRLVGGHPMVTHTVTDDITKQPKMQADGVTPRTEAYVGIAIAKGVESDWRQTPWGQQISLAAQTGWPNGEFNAPAFAWKITDGDSQVPNKVGKKPFDREGFPGHWVVNCSNGFAIRSYHPGRYDPTQQIQDKNAIKCGDYCRVLINAVANAPSQSPGVYLNPMLFELSRAGIEIVTSSGPDAAAAFGAAAAVLPANAMVDNTVQQTAEGAQQAHQQAQQPTVQQPAAQQPAVQQPVTPANDFVTGPGGGPAAPAAVQEVKYIDANGGQFTEAQLLAAGYQAAQIAALPRA
jgi:hypothetical protein